MALETRIQNAFNWLSETLPALAGWTQLPRDTGLGRESSLQGCSVERRLSHGTTQFLKVVRAARVQATRQTRACLSGLVGSL